MTLTPPIFPPIIFAYSATLATGNALPTNWIQFDPISRFFTVQSSDSSLDEVYNITVTAVSTDSRWTGQTISSHVGIVTKKAELPKYAISTDDDVVEGFVAGVLGQTSEFTFEQNL